MFKAVNDYITSWSDCAGICTGGAALTGHKKGFHAELRLVTPRVNFIHYIIHRETSALRDLQLHAVLQEAVKVVNVVQARPLNSRLFAVLCARKCRQTTSYFCCIQRQGGYQEIHF
jgi:hypothetical protein